MDQTVLVDSNIFIDLLRQDLDPVTELTERVAQTDLATCGMVRVEVLRGVKRPKTKAKLKDFFDVMRNVPTDNRLWEESADLAWKLDRQGIVIPATDIIIATSALRIGAVVLTLDKHFKGIPGLQVQDWN